jgi:hypothetical protein
MARFHCRACGEKATFVHSSGWHDWQNVASIIAI